MLKRKTNEDLSHRWWVLAPLGIHTVGLMCASMVLDVRVMAVNAVLAV